MLLATAFYGGLNALTESAEGQLQQGLASQENRLAITPGSGQMVLRYGGFPIQADLSYRGRDLPNDALIEVERFVERGDLLWVQSFGADDSAEGRGALTRIEAQARDSQAMQTVIAELTELITEATIVPIRDAEEGRQELVEQMALFRLYLLVLTTLAIVALVTAFTNLSVQERKKEMAIYGAIGFPRRALITIMVGEIALMSLIGALGGMVLGFWGATVVADLGAMGITTTWTFSNLISTITPLLLATVLGALLSLSKFFWSQGKHMEQL
ncbi:ABC transporter permease [Heliorestis acidaminivorans]|nr:ABC transporter permease [Heliorestis acidaminivorans]